VWVSARRKEVVFEMTDEQINPSMGPFNTRVSRKEQSQTADTPRARRGSSQLDGNRVGIQGTRFFVAAVTLTSVAAPGPHAYSHLLARGET
jgi:hypothetical protein